ncbi:MAG TPA: methyltransferase domain-containing protein [Verrucomicrobia bacterium]|nr:methyltransferase domain-containing protein [Verrucomicrobiales bacterium]HIL55172.1 methyltransferase domain-containing protein [Verrucomicrobiota bacterium]
MNKESAVKERYAAGADIQEEALCCPVEYDPKYLDIIPEEVIEKDYGCGDPSQYLKEGETVLDLGSGTGKICFIASQVVGAKGKVIGVDMTDDMLEVARRNAPIIADRIGYANVEFRKGRIQDLALDLELLDQGLAQGKENSSEAYLKAEQLASQIRSEKPMISNESVDVVVSNCVLNLVDNNSKKQLFNEIYRVLKRGGRAVISDIVSDEPVPQEMQDDDELWSGCISGAFLEEEFLSAFEEAGFYGVRVLKLDTKPWQTVEGIEFRSMTIEAFKGKEGTCLERNQAVIYKGPFKQVLDDDGNAMERGKRYAVCDKVYNIYKNEPYSDCFELIDPIEEISINEAKIFDCSITRLRNPKETKGMDYKVTGSGSDCCGESNCC